LATARAVYRGVVIGVFSRGVVYGPAFALFVGVLPYPLPQVDWLGFALVSWIGFLMLFGFTQRIAASYREKIAIQDQLISEQAQKQGELEAAVQQRTRALHKAMIDADEANRAKSYFLAKVSHDLKSPLTSILGYSQQISAFQHAEVAHKSSIIFKSARRLLALVNDLIDYASGERHLETLEPKLTYALDFFNSVAEEARALAKINHNRFVFSLQGALPKVLLMDTKRLHQVLMNVLSNACKFTHQGEVRFGVQADVKPQGPCALQIRIEDSGCGIEAEQLSHIFEPFTKYNHAISSEGMGLGLAIAKQWLDAMKAEIVVDSQIGSGTQVCIRVCLDSVEEGDLSAQDVVIEHIDLPWFDGAGKRVWLIEDAPLILQLLDGELRALNMAVVALSDGQQALALIAQAEQAPDVIITDCYLPGADGRQILQAARARWPTLPVVLISAVWRDGEVNTTGFESFSAQLLKAIDLADFRQTLAGLLTLPLNPSVGYPSADGLPWQAVEPVWSASWSQALQEGLSEPQKHTLCDLISLNAVSDIMDWAAALKADNPALSEALDALSALARQSDLNALSALATLLAQQTGDAEGGGLAVGVG
jgi:signal transduction histidine kinase